MIEYDHWKGILSAIDADKNFSKNDVILKIIEKLPKDSDEYKEWEKDSFGVNHLFAIGYRLLHLAIRYNLKNVVNALLGVEEINVNAKDKYGNTPLSNAAYLGCTKTVRALIDKGANVNAADNNGCTPLFLACENDQTEVVDLLLKREGIDVDAIDSAERTPLHMATQYDYKKIVKTLIGAGANVNAADDNGCTPLFLACENGRTEVIDLLLKREGIDVDAIDSAERTPLHMATQYDYKKIVKTLIGAGANVDAVDDNGYTPLHIATQFRHAKMVKILVGAGANVDAVDENNYTPLHMATQHDCKEIVKTLIGAGANVNAVDKNKCTPLHMAALHGHKEVIETLIDKRADLLSKDNDNKIPSNFDTNHYIVRHVNFLLSEARMKRHNQHEQISLAAFSLTILFGTAITITLFATGTITAGLYPVIGVVVTVVAAALAVAYTTVRMLEPSTKMDETKEAQNVNGNVKKVFF